MIADTAEIMAHEVQQLVTQGWAVEAQTDKSATLVKRSKKVNHVLHALLSLLTVGLWLWVWLVLVLWQKKEERINLYVGTDGKVTRAQSS